MAAFRTLLTGASGFVGRYAVDALLTRGTIVYGTGSAVRPPWFPKDTTWITVDLLDAEQVKTLPVQFDAVLHLAGDSVPSQMQGVAQALRNARMVAHLLDHLAPTRFMLVSSCHVYAPGAASKDEHSPIGPVGAYGLSKHLAEQVTLLNLRGFQSSIVRPFNHVGRGMRPELLIPQLLSRISAAPTSQEPLVMHGQDSVRDFLDVRDIMAAYAELLIEWPGTEHIFNICSGVGVRISDLVKTAMALAGTTRPVTFGARNSTDDTDILVGTPARLKALTTWSPRYTLQESLAWSLEL